MVDCGIGDNVVAMIDQLGPLEVAHDMVASRPICRGLLASKMRRATNFAGGCLNFPLAMLL